MRSPTIAPHGWHREASGSSVRRRRRCCLRRGRHAGGDGGAPAGLHDVAGLLRPRSRRRRAALRRWALWPPSAAALVAAGRDTPAGDCRGACSSPRDDVHVGLAHSHRTHAGGVDGPHWGDAGVAVAADDRRRGCPGRCAAGGGRRRRSRRGPAPVRHRAQPHAAGICRRAGPRWQALDGPGPGQRGLHWRAPGGRIGAAVDGGG